MANKGWRDMDDVSTGSKDKAARPEDLVKIAKFKDGKWTQVRLLPGVIVSAQYWVKGKKKNGEKTKFPKPVPGFDSSTGNQDSEVYDPWREAADQLNVYSEERDKSDVVVQFDKKFWMNAIIRKEQENEPSKAPKHTKEERETGVKDRDSDSWTPVEVIRMPKTLMERIQGLKSMNVKKNKKTGETNSYSMSHPKFGCDILIKYNKDASPASQWEVQKGERTPLTEEEEALLVHDLDLLSNPNVEEQEVRTEFDRWVKQNNIKLKGKKAAASDDDDDEDDDPKPKKGKKSRDDDDEDFDEPKGKKGKKSKSDDDDDDDDFDEPKRGKKSKSDDDEDDEEDPKPKKSKKSKSDDDDDDDFDEKPKVKKSKKSRDDEDDEDDEDDDEPKPKKGKKSKPRDDDDDEDDDDPKPRKGLSRDDDDDDDDDEPKPKKGKGKKSKKSDDDDDDGWNDDDDD